MSWLRGAIDYPKEGHPDRLLTGLFSEVVEGKLKTRKIDVIGSMGLQVQQRALEAFPGIGYGYLCLYLGGSLGRLRSGCQDRGFPFRSR